MDGGPGRPTHTQHIHVMSEGEVLRRIAKTTLSRIVDEGIVDTLY